MSCLYSVESQRAPRPVDVTLYAELNMLPEIFCVVRLSIFFFSLSLSAHHTYCLCCVFIFTCRIDLLE